MKKIKIALTCLTFALALTGVVVAKENEKKRATFFVGYVDSGGNPYSITLQGQDFDETVTATGQARLVNGAAGNNPKVIWQTQTFTNDVKHIIP